MEAYDSPAFKGTGTPLKADDFRGAAEGLGCEEAALRAFASVESRGHGFDSKGRPIILFEPHKFYKHLGDTPERDAAVKAGLAYEKWGTRKYPGGTEIKQQDANYARLAQALGYNPEAAYSSISIGMGQVLGENYHMLGLGSARDMFQEALRGEKEQLGHMVGYLKAAGLVRWLNPFVPEKLAEGYNGPGQVKKYGPWLNREYLKWKRILAKPREELTAKDLKEAGSKTIEGTSGAKNALTTAATSVAAATAVSDQVKSVVEPVQDLVTQVKGVQGYLDWFKGNWEVVLVVVLGGIAVWAIWHAWTKINQAEEERVRAARTGINGRI